MQYQADVIDIRQELKIVDERVNSNSSFDKFE
jgi:hypothetical protein